MLNKTTPLILLYVMSIILGTVLYVGLFRSHLVNTQSVPVVGAMALLLVTCLILVVALTGFKFTQYFSNSLTYRDIAIITLVFFLFNSNLYGMIPFNCSRSNSIIMMGYLYKNNGTPKSEKEIQDFVEQEYFQKYRAIQKRLQEQVNAGNVKKVRNDYVITKRGSLIIQFFGWVTDFYHMDHNFTKV